jgi:hypothetical protein
MLVPEKEMQHLSPKTHDLTIASPNQAKPSHYDKRNPLREEEIILCKTEKDDTSWCLTEVNKIFPNEVEVVYYTTPELLMDGYATATKPQR